MHRRAEQRAFHLKPHVCFASSGHGASPIIGREGPKTRLMHPGSLGSITKTATQSFPCILGRDRLSMKRLGGSQMRRREFIAGLGSAVAWPVIAQAQQGDRVRRIGVLMSGDDDLDGKFRVSAFTQ